MHLHASLLAVALFTPLAVAQDFLHYKFDSTCTTEVINYATGPQALPMNGVLQSTSPISPYTTGVFGSALAAGSTATPAYYNRVVTGWNPGTQNVTGSLTMAWFMRQNTANGSPFYFMGAPTGGFRLFTNGVAGRGLYQRVILASGGNGVNASVANDFYLPATTVDILTLASAGWVHVAMVIDAVAQTADWYVNGTSVLQLTGVVGGALINAAGPFQIGYYSSAGHFDIDEFLMSFRAYTAAEIFALSLSPQGGDGRYLSGIASQCGSATLDSFGGRPSLGNTSYGLNLNTSITGFYSLLLGVNRCTLAGTVPLPLDLGLLTPAASGCWLLTDTFASSTGVVTGAPLAMPLPLPNNSSLYGVTFYSQAAVLDFANNGVSATNGWSIGLGF